MDFVDKLINCTEDELPLYELETNTKYSKNTTAYTILGNKFYNIQNDTKAEEYLLKSLILDKSNFPSFYILCLLYTQQKDEKINKLLDTYFGNYELINKLKIITIIKPIFPEITLKILKTIAASSVFTNEELKNNIYLNIIHLSGLQKTNIDLLHCLDFCRMSLSIKITENAINSYYLARNYISSKIYELYPTDSENNRIDLDKFYKLREYVPHKKPNDLIHIGFISPDLNKNAVSMFSKNILNNMNPEKFKIFVYYDNGICDEYFEELRENKTIAWINIHKIPNETVYQYIHDIDKIDVLINLLVISKTARNGLFYMRPAKYIINYLGFPGSTFMNCYTHRIVDKITDPPKYANQYNSEKLLYMPKTFICWNNILITNKIDFQPNININVDTNKIIIGITNRPEKISPKCISWWNRLSAKHDIVFVVKSKKDIKDLKNTIYLRDYYEDRKDYYDLFNSFDYTMDTYPYSGTTTTAASLFMGCPVITLYDEKNHHVSNVSASFNINSGLEKYVVKDYSKFKFVKFRDNYQRKMIRKKFLNCMEPKGFIKAFENMLEKIN